MTKINVYDFCMMFYKGKEITVYVWNRSEDGSTQMVEHHYFDAMDSALYQLRDYHVDQFKATKKGCIEIIASNF